MSLNIKLVLEICWWYYLKSEICSKNARKNTRFVKNGDRMELLGNDDVSPLNCTKYGMVRDDVKQKMPEDIKWYLLHLYASTVVRFVFSVTFCEAAVLKLLKNAIYISSSHFVLLNKRHKLWPRKRKRRVWPKLWTERHSVSVDLRVERRITVYKHLKGLPDICLSFTNPLLLSLSLTTWTHPNAIDTSKSLIGNDFTDIHKSLWGNYWEA